MATTLRTSVLTITAGLAIALAAALLAPPGLPVALAHDAAAQDGTGHEGDADDPDALPQPEDEVPAPPQTCDVETGMQGQVPAADRDSGRAADGYCRNADLMATSPVQEGTTRGNVVRVEDCAYVGAAPDDGAGLAVVDVSDPTDPRTVEVFPGVSHTWDTLDFNAERRILVAKTELGGFVRDTSGFHIYSVGEDCRSLTPRGTFDAATLQPGTERFDRSLTPHELRVSPDGTYVVMSQSIPDLGTSAVSDQTTALLVADITDLDDPQPLGTFDMSAALREAGVAAAGLGFHDFAFDHEGARTYAGMFTGELVGDGRSDNPIWPGTAVLDVTGIHDGEIGVVDVLPVGGHTARFGIIDGREYVITNTEFDCMLGVPAYAPAGVQIVDVTDEANPEVVAKVSLEVNESPEACLATAEDRTRNYAHFGEFDDPFDARMYLVSWSSAGVRAFDIRDPRNPTEIAYVNPGEGAVAYSYPDYDPTSREIVWAGDGTGLNIARLHPDALRPGEGVPLAQPAPPERWRSVARALGVPLLVCSIEGPQERAQAVRRLANPAAPTVRLP